MEVGYDDHGRAVAFIDGGLHVAEDWECDCDDLGDPP